MNYYDMYYFVFTVLISLVLLVIGIVALPPVLYILGGIWIVIGASWLAQKIAHWWYYRND